MLAVLLPMLVAVIGLVFDGGVMMYRARSLQAVTDAAATAAAVDLRLGKTAAAAEATANEIVKVANQLPDAVVTVHIPPLTGEFAGQAGYVEVECEIVHRPSLMPILDDVLDRPLVARATAGVADVTQGAAIVVLDPDPSELSIPPLPGLPPLPSLLAGLEVEGLGRLLVHGAVLVNTEWGGVDENGDTVGAAAGPPYAVTCMPLLPLTKVLASDIRVVGGVDNPDNYQNISSNQPSPLQANRLPVPDPYADLPVPSTSSDPNNVSTTLRGGVTVAGLPLIGPPVTLRPGVYEYIRVLSGVANFEPGIYIIRGVDPVTQSALSIVAGTVQADGVMFYITNSSAYEAATGAPDSGQSGPPSAPGITALPPSVLIQGSILGSGMSGLADSSSPFDGMLIYQQEQDRRPIVLIHQNLIGSGDISGSIYAKWGHVIFLGNGTYDLRFVCGTLRILTVFDTTLVPSRLFPPAQDVLLLE